MNKITINNYNGKLDIKFLNTLNEVLDWFNYEVTFENNVIKLRQYYVDRTEEFMDGDTNYDNFNQFLEDWICTCEEPMEEDPLIDYNDWLNILKMYR